MSDSKLPTVDLDRLSELMKQAREAWRPPRFEPPRSLQNLTMPQGRCLWLITHHENCTLRELCALMQIRPSTASAYIDRLVSAGLVTRTNDCSDRRVIRLRLTRRGRDVHNQFQKAEREQLLQMTQNCSNEDLQQLVQSLETMTAILTRARGDEK